jgi:RimJ/RimL family protein N-acetyltransferase
MRCQDCGLSTASNRERCLSCSELRREEIYVKPLSHEDLELVLAWRSNPEIYQYFRGQDEPLRWEDHLRWFRSRDSERYDFIIWFSGRRVGVVSLDTDNRVSIYIGDFSARNEGVATASLRWLCQRFKKRSPIKAEIHHDNNASRQLFDRCGFDQQRAKNEWLQYVYRP